MAWGGGQGGTFHVEVDGVDVTGPLQIPDTNWATFSTVTKAGVQLTAGPHVMRVVADTNAGNGITGDFDNFQFTLDSAGGVSAGADIRWLVLLQQSRLSYNPPSSSAITLQDSSS